MDQVQKGKRIHRAAGKIEEHCQVQGIPDHDHPEKEVADGFLIFLPVHEIQVTGSLKTEDYEEQRQGDFYIIKEGDDSNDQHQAQHGPPAETEEPGKSYFRGICILFGWRCYGKRIVHGKFYICPLPCSMCSFSMWCS